MLQDAISTTVLYVVTFAVQDESKAKQIFTQATKNLVDAAKGTTYLDALKAAALTEGIPPYAQVTSTPLPVVAKDLTVTTVKSSSQTTADIPVVPIVVPIVIFFAVGGLCYYYWSELSATINKISGGFINRSSVLPQSEMNIQPGNQIEVVPQ